MSEQNPEFAYQKEGVLGLIDHYPADTKIHVSIPGHGERDMTMGELARQIETLQESDVGRNAIRKIDVRILE
ncbi:hypothetical protein COV06_00555 [Candidatus Uhrbacteria bacterium CG10_big_fil_rev_8_21_14_0_10_50_16]|uniref:Uncharacterized protein n=1 Tax=Candidatus Uhrbacteria bacterium CG10_big_fil_rev_8_21_14_0_10_50_16 TaxID=1975039 RepID=A0A2H0RMZ5_9BACT|nr:MAG: hypothetical protein COV06_00555 [Candidatus Uhrbacteria bacterium CG10_big_fil_rev_8_21_14_0_10_50_16]